MPRPKTLIFALLPVILLAATASLLVAQGAPPGQLASQSLRPYWHVFIAYAIAIVLVMGWVISIGRRLRDVEERIGD